MPEQGTSPTARLAAVGTLIVVFIAAIAVIASTGGSDDNDEDSGPGQTGGNITAAQPTKQSKDVETALARGEYVVEPGDNLTTISDATGIDIDTLLQLNPNVDPQRLQEGARIRLK